MPDLLTTREAAEYLRCHPSTLRARARQWGVPRFKQGKGWRYPRAELERWVSEQVDDTKPKARRPRRRRRVINDEQAEREALEMLATP